MWLPVTVYLPVDAAFIEKERARLVREIEDDSAEAGRIEAKLASAGFVKKAPAEVVEKERARLDGLRDAVAAARGRLASL